MLRDGWDLKSLALVSRPGCSFSGPLFSTEKSQLLKENCLNSFLEPTNHSGGSTTQIESFLISVFRHDILMSPETRCISLIN